LTCEGGCTRPACWSPLFRVAEALFRTLFEPTAHFSRLLDSLSSCSVARFPAPPEPLCLRAGALRCTVVARFLEWLEPLCLCVGAPHLAGARHCINGENDWTRPPELASSCCRIPFTPALELCASSHRWTPSPPRWSSTMLEPVTASVANRNATLQIIISNRHVWFSFVRHQFAATRP
jgi:hypothetical protein